MRVKPHRPGQANGHRPFLRQRQYSAKGWPAPRPPFFGVAKVKPQICRSGFWVQGLPGPPPPPLSGPPGPWWLDSWTRRLARGPGRLVAQFLFWSKTSYGFSLRIFEPPPPPGPQGLGASPGAPPRPPPGRSGPAGKAHARQSPSQPKAPPKARTKKWPRGYFKKRGGTPGSAMKNAFFVLKSMVSRHPKRHQKASKGFKRPGVK